MGVKSNFFFILIIILSFDAYSETKNDTVIFSGKKYIRHIVNVGESLRSISETYNVKPLEIQRANELKKRLFYKQILYIPVNLNFHNSQNKTQNTNEVLIDTSKLNIALLMPYYLLSNDTINDDNDTLYNEYNIISDAALAFHIGVELALDSLRNIGKNIVLHTYDTNQDSVTVHNIVNSKELNNMDIIIGPMYSNLFNLVCKRFGNDTSKILISPLSRDNRYIRTFKSVFQVALTYKVQADILFEYLIENKISERIIILHDKNDRGLAFYLSNRFQKYNKTVDNFQIEYSSVDSIRKYFSDFQNVLLVSKNKAFIGKMLGSIGSIDSSSTVFSFESITSYENLDITNLMELNVHIPNSRSIDNSNDYDINFVNLFEREYKTNAHKYTKVGYDIIMHFCNNMNIFNFRKSDLGYNENIFGPISRYYDFQLIPVK